MRELLWQIEELNRQQDTWDVIGYVDISDAHGTIRVGDREYPYLGNDDFLLNEKIAKKLMANPQIRFPNLIMGDTRVCSDVQLGQGVIISMDCKVSTNVSIGDFTFLNIGSVVCHDGRLGDYVTLSPDVRLAGNVSVGSGSDLGMGTRVIQGIRIGTRVITGAGSVVVRDLPDLCTAVGVPASVRELRFV